MRELMALVALLLVTGCSSPPAVDQTTDSRDRPPIVDMHLHAYSLAEGTAPPENPVTGRPATSRTTAELRDATLAALARHNIVKAVTSGPAETVAQWRAASPARVLGGAYVDENNPLPNLATLRADILAGRVQVLGELVLQHMGMAPNDPRLEPYFALAEELNLPVGIHTGIGPPGTPYLPGPQDFRVTLGNPALVEEVLVRHPRLRVYLMHGGAPYLQETKAILAVYPQVYLDLATINWILPRQEFHNYLRELMVAGFGKRLLFGSDQMFWPEAIGMAIEGIESASFLSEQEKRDIFYNNAVCFLKLEGK
jgi:hypothetical protein